MNQTISIEASHDRMGAVEHFIKRLADIMCSLLGLILLSPVYAVIVVLMKRQHNGSVFSVKSESATKESRSPYISLGP